ncbi:MULTISPECIES: ABC transporter substrate-binding protein [Clostridium]|uniref:Solute-binding protein family 3/N-terminal domain-containing protein n=2 Tax=Clostridium TaxID=1485 RepID=A0A1S9N607_CLOBE|nr:MULTISPECIES: ABC transporter substrate-binding protein [Clostridium]EKQ54843.1 MAG: ABC transporter, substrate-binding protein, aliphatic sulfonates family [Clostridium sp. Maddingley MBC34-26]MZK51562.1 aliphatic sulfonate ABC transporter substrate-binding protein [Clostridium beijerinckii]MZK59837.1 aliphatic sulfonate ABC transporter substrate-binding protein [Clostridium beijerinckii]MZK70122.1 aliphatic sulfonate ABC transporter substrate-binding protein [Clostridium beijerinckii]MZK7
MKKIVSILVSMFMLLGLYGCGANNNTNKIDNTTAQVSDEKIIKIGITQWPGSYVWYGVEKRGFFEKNGVKAEVQMFPVYSDGINALASGNIDMFMASYSDTIAPYKNGSEFKIAMVEDYSAGSDGIVVKDGINSLKDLKGKNVATEFGSVDQMFLYKCLEKEGLKKDDINLTNMTIGDAGNAFIAGQVDAAAIWDPSLSLAVENGGKLLYTTKDTPGLIPAVMAVNNETLENKRDDVKKIINAWYDGIEDFNTNHDEFVKYVAEEAKISADDFNKLMSGVKLATLDDNALAFENSNDNMSLEYSGKEHAEFLKSAGLIDDVPKDIAPLLDGSIVDEVIKERKK